MITPALLLLGSASLVASVLVRMARIVDRARVLSVLAHEDSFAKIGVTADQLRAWLESHALRARYAERSIALLYAAIVVFISTCLSIAADRALGGSLSWLPVMLAVMGTLLLLTGGAYMVAESRLSGEQIGAEIQLAIHKLDPPRAALGRPIS
jgi:hypothetical protein